MTKKIYRRGISIIYPANITLSRTVAPTARPASSPICTTRPHNHRKLIIDQREKEKTEALFICLKKNGEEDELVAFPYPPQRSTYWIMYI